MFVEVSVKTSYLKISISRSSLKHTKFKTIDKDLTVFLLIVEMFSLT